MSAPVYVFDAYGTLFDVHAAIARFRDAIGPEADRMSALWRVKQLEYTWTLTLMGRYRDFRDVTGDALDVAAAECGGLPDGLRHKLLEAYEELDVYPDVVPVLTALREKGSRLAILSNGSPAMLGNMTRAASVDHLFDAVLSVDALRLYKPAPSVYGLVEDTFGTKPADVSFQSSNRWDIAGAKAFGFRCVWINRTGKPEEYGALSPDRVVASLDALL